MSLPMWNAATWGNLFDKIGSKPAPMFNSLVLVFRDMAQFSIRASWRDLLKRFLSGEVPWPYPDGRLFEQWSLAMAIAKEAISYGELGPKEHAFGWCTDSADGATIFHYGNCVLRPALRACF